MSEEKKIDWFNMTKEEVTRMISRAIACDKFSHVKVDEKFAEDGGDNRKTKFFATYMVFDGQNCYLVEIATAEANISSDWQVYAYFEPKSAELKFEMSITNMFKLAHDLHGTDKGRDVCKIIEVLCHAYYTTFAKNKPWHCCE